MGTVRQIDGFADRWVWIESMPMPLVVLDLGTRLVVAQNGAARDLLGLSASELVARPISSLVPDYLIPRADVVAQWVEQASAGQTPGFSIDLLLESPESGALSLNAHIGPADASGQHILLRLAPPPGEEIRHTDGNDEVIRGLMSDIGRIVSSSFDLSTVCQQFAISLMQVVPADHVAILLKAGEGDSLNLMFSSEQGAEPGSSDTRHLTPIPDGPFARAMQTNASVLLNPSEIDELASMGARAQVYAGRSVQSACCIPLIAAGNSIGVVLLGSSQRDAFDTDDLILLEQASSQVAGAISNVMLHEALSQSALERDVLANIGRLASSAIDFTGALPGIAAEVQRIMPVAEHSACTSQTMPPAGWHAHTPGRNLEARSISAPKAGLKQP